MVTRQLKSSFYKLGIGATHDEKTGVATLDLVLNDLMDQIDTWRTKTPAEQQAFTFHLDEKDAIAANIDFRKYIIKSERLQAQIVEEFIVPLMQQPVASRYETETVCPSTKLELIRHTRIGIDVPKPDYDTALTSPDLMLAEVFAPNCSFCADPHTTIKSRTLYIPEATLPFFETVTNNRQAIVKFKEQRMRLNLGIKRVGQKVEKDMNSRLKRLEDAFTTSENARISRWKTEDEGVLYASSRLKDWPRIRDKTKRYIREYYQAIFDRENQQLNIDAIVGSNDKALNGEDPQLKDVGDLNGIKMLVSENRKGTNNEQKYGRMLIRELRQKYGAAFTVATNDVKDHTETPRVLPGSNGKLNGWRGYKFVGQFNLDNSAYRIEFQIQTPTNYQKDASDHKAYEACQRELDEQVKGQPAYAARPEKKDTTPTVALPMDKLDYFLRTVFPD